MRGVDCLPAYRARDARMGIMDGFARRGGANQPVPPGRSFGRHPPVNGLPGLTGRTCLPLKPGAGTKRAQPKKGLFNQARLTSNVVRGFCLRSFYDDFPICLRSSSDPFTRNLRRFSEGKSGTGGCRRETAKGKIRRYRWRAGPPGLRRHQ